MNRNRRKPVSFCVALVCLGALLTGCGNGSDTGSETAGQLTFVGYGSKVQELMAKAYQEPFVDESGIKFRNDSPVDVTKLRAMVDSGNVSWDVSAMSSGEAIKYCGKYLEQNDPALVDMSVLGANQKIFTSKCGVPYAFAPSVFVYNTDKFKDEAPSSVSDFFNTTRFPGKRAIEPVLEQGLLEIALMADGVAPQDLYPLDIKRALAKLGTIKEHLIFTDSYGALQQSLENGVAMALTVTTRLYNVLQDGAPYEVVWDKSIIQFDYFVVPKGSKNIEAAQRFLNFVLQEPQQTKAAELMGVLPVNPASKPSFDDIQQAIDPLSAEHEDSVVYIDAEWWSEHVEDAYKAYTAWQVG